MEYGKIEHCLLFMRNVRCVLETNTRKIKLNIDRYIKETTTKICKRTKNKNQLSKKLFDGNILYRTDVIKKVLIVEPVGRVWFLSDNRKSPYHQIACR